MAMRSAYALALVCATAAQAGPELASDLGLDGFITAEQIPLPENAILAQGHGVFAQTCQNCHGGNKATGAPKVTSLRAWAPRLDQGMDVLIDHALNGFIGPKYTQMPARGANPDLTDEEVASAVAFMVWISGGAQMATTFITELEQ